MASRDELTLEGELLHLLVAEPFAVFSITLTRGERLDVDLPDRLIVGQNVATLLGSGGSVVIRKNQIVTIDSTNGRH